MKVRLYDRCDGYPKFMEVILNSYKDLYYFINNSKSKFLEKNKVKSYDKKWEEFCSELDHLKETYEKLHPLTGEEELIDEVGFEEYNIKLAKKKIETGKGSWTKQSEK